MEQRLNGPRKRHLDPSQITVLNRYTLTVVKSFFVIESDENITWTFGSGIWLANLQRQK